MLHLQKIRMNGLKLQSAENTQIKHFTIRYIDIEQPLKDERDQQLAEKIHNDEYFYPLVLINNEVIGEGYIQIKPVFQALEKLGFIPSQSKISAVIS